MFYIGTLGLAACALPHKTEHAGSILSLNYFLSRTDLNSI